jgi:hypothetical protein
MKELKLLSTVELDDGKYEFYKDENNVLCCNRYGEEWRDFTGDHAVTLLFERLIELKEENYINEQAMISMAEELQRIGENHYSQSEDWEDMKTKDVVYYFIDKYLYR